jgi:outer membrane protein OmpA-like peptidoglycan-associated protein
MASFRSTRSLSVITLAALLVGGLSLVAHAQSAQERQQAAAARAAQQRAVQQQAAAARAAQQQAAAARANQQRAAQEQARAAQQRAAQEQARAAQQRAAQEQARAAQQRAAQEQARAAQQRAAQEQARAAQQRAAQEQARAAQQRAAQEQARAAQQRAAQEQTRAAQQRIAQERTRASEQRGREGPAALPSLGQPRPDQNRTRVGQDARRRTEGHPTEAPSRRLLEVQRQRQERRQADRIVIQEPGRRAIVRDNTHAFIRHDDNQRLARMGRGARNERQGEATALSFSSRNGARVYSEVNEEGRALRRYRRLRDGREITLFDDRPFYGPGLATLRTSFVDLAPPVIDIPQEQYIVDYGAASEDDIYQALAAPPVEPLQRSYALEEIRQGYELRERMRSVELLDITFETGSWEITPDQYPKLAKLARAINRILDGRPDEVFFIEGYTDVLDSDIDNLTLSDRRAEAVAFILSQMFAVPAENLVTQGYGDQYLKADAGRTNRRVSVRRITPLLRQQDASVALRSERQSAPPSGVLDLSDDERALIVANIDFSTEPDLGIGGLSEGMRVPGGARMRSFPNLLRQRIPTLEAYRYFVADNQIAIVDPVSAEVVAIVEGNR